MYITVLQKVFSIFMTVIALCTNTMGLFGQKSETPTAAERVTYGEGACEYFDLYVPSDVGSKADILFLIHGGAWMQGDGSEFNDSCVEATDNYGYITVNFDYEKLQNGATAADMVNEIGTAMAKVKDVLTSKSITPGKVIIVGHSAGAHLALLYSYQNYASSPIEIAFVVSNCAPTEFLKDATAGTTTMGKSAYLAMTALSGQVITPETVDDCKEYIDAITPLTFVSASVPPTIVVQGDKDEMVPYENSTDLYNALTENGVDTIRVTYEGAGHFLGAEFTDANAQRAAAFFTFAEKYL